MTKMAAMPVYGKIPLKSFSMQPVERFYETWYVAPGTPAHHCLFKNDSRLTLNCFFFFFCFFLLFFLQGQILQIMLLYRNMWQWWILKNYYSLESQTFMPPGLMFITCWGFSEVRLSFWPSSCGATVILLYWLSLNSSATGICATGL